MMERLVGRLGHAGPLAYLRRVRCTTKVMRPPAVRHAASNWRRLLSTSLPDFSGPVRIIESAHRDRFRTVIWQPISSLAFGESPPAGHPDFKRICHSPSLVNSFEPCQSILGCARTPDGAKSRSAATPCRRLQSGERFWLCRPAPLKRLLQQHQPSGGISDASRLAGPSFLKVLY